MFSLHSPSTSPLRGRRRKAAIVGSAVALAAATTLTGLVGATAAHAAGATLAVTLTTADGANNLAAQSSVSLGAVSNASPQVLVNDSLTSQTITAGFGAAFTDSSTSLLVSLKANNPSAYNSVMQQLFNTSTGWGLNYWRVSMSSNDFNSYSAPFTDDDNQGPASNPTANFALSPSDTNHVIPVIKDALAINPNLQLVASPWSAPGWMKTPSIIYGSDANGTNTQLQTQYYQAWADYFVKWIKGYQSAGVPIAQVTPQNEPYYAPPTYPGMYWTPANMNTFVHTYLAPDLTANSLTQKIEGFDHNWEYLDFPAALLSGSAAGDIAGLAYHCYDNASDPAAMTEFHNQNPTKAAYETECSSDTAPTNIINYGTADMTSLSTQNWAQGVILWNVALDPNGGPHLGGCSGCKGMLVINNNTVTYNNLAYQFAQTAKFVNVGATHIASSANAHGIVTSAYKNPSGQEVLVATNTNSSSTTFTTTWNGQGSFSYTLPSRATVTFTGTVAAATVLSSTPTAGHVFRIASRQSGKDVNVSGSSTANSAQIVQNIDSGDTSEQWRLVDAGSGYFNIINVNSGLALDDPSGSTSNGTIMQQYGITGTGNSNQQWQITAVGSGFYKIVNRTSGLSLDLTGGSLAENTAIQQYSAAGNGNFGQNWQFLPVS